MWEHVFHLIEFCWWHMTGQISAGWHCSSLSLMDMMGNNLDCSLIMEWTWHPVNLFLLKWPYYNKISSIIDVFQCISVVSTCFSKILHDKPKVIRCEMLLSLSSSSQPTSESLWIFSTFQLDLLEVINSHPLMQISSLQIFNTKTQHNSTLLWIPLEKTVAWTDEGLP